MGSYDFPGLRRSLESCCHLEAPPPRSPLAFGNGVFYTVPLGDGGARVPNTTCTGAVSVLTRMRRATGTSDSKPININLTSLTVLQSNEDSGEWLVLLLFSEGLLNPFLVNPCIGWIAGP